MALLLLVLLACHAGPDGVCDVSSPYTMRNDPDCPCVAFLAKKNDSQCRPDQRPGLIWGDVWCICVAAPEAAGRR